MNVVNANGMYGLPFDDTVRNIRMINDKGKT